MVWRRGKEVRSEAEVSSRRPRKQRHRIATCRGATRPSERGRRIDPQNPCLGAARVFPAMRGGALKIQTVARLQMVAAFVMQQQLELPTQHVQKFFTFVRVGFSAATTWPHTEQVRLHGR